MNEFISIADFAARAGVSKQAVYKRLPTIESKLIKVENGKKTIDINALSLFAANQDNQPFKDKKPTKTNVESDLIKELRKQIDGLQADKIFLQEQITELTKSLQYEQRKTAELQQLLPATAENKPAGAGAAAPDPAPKTENSESGKNDPAETKLSSFFGRIMRKKK